MKSRMIVLTLVVTVVGFVTMFNQNPLYSFHQSRTTPVVIVDAQGKLLTSLFEGRTPSPFHVLFFDKNSRNFGKHSTAGVCAQKPNPKSPNWWQRLTLNASTFFLTTVYAQGCSNCASSVGTWCPEPDCNANYCWGSGLGCREFPSSCNCYDTAECDCVG